MKKLLTSLLLLALLGGMAFAEDEGEGDFMHVQAGASSPSEMGSLFIISGWV
jgi:hypothetical protein